MAIASEAGGHTFGSKSSSSLDTGVVDADLVVGRKYIVVRGLPDGLEGQKRIAKEFYSFVEEWTP